jgi:hypothetical protein
LKFPSFLLVLRHPLIVSGCPCLPETVVDGGLIWGPRKAPI